MKTLIWIWSKIKNWWLYVLIVIGAILDLGFDQLQPSLEQLGMGPKWMGALRILVIILGALKLKLSLPTQNIEKLEEIVETKKDKL